MLIFACAYGMHVIACPKGKLRKEIRSAKRVMFFPVPRRISLFVPSNVVLVGCFFLNPCPHDGSLSLLMHKYTERKVRRQCSGGFKRDGKHKRRKNL